MPLDKSPKPAYTISVTKKPNRRPKMTKSPKQDSTEPKVNLTVLDFCDECGAFYPKGKLLKHQKSKCHAEGKQARKVLGALKQRSSIHRSL
jgi:hypothetical protein